MLNRRTLMSWEFLATVLSSLAVWLTAMASSSVGYNTATYWTAGAAGVYALARGLAKVNHDGKDWWQTSEVPIVVLAAVVASVSALQDVINAHTYGRLMAALTAVSAIANGLRKVPAVQADVDTGDLPTEYDPDYAGEAVDPGTLPDDVPDTEL